MNESITLTVFYPDGDKEAFTTEDETIKNIKNTSGTSGSSYTINFINGNKIELRNLGFAAVTENKGI